MRSNQRVACAICLLVEEPEVSMNTPANIEVIIPGPLSPLRGALASCAIEGNQFAIDALETIRRVEAGLPVGERYARALNAFMQAEAP